MKCRKCGEEAVMLVPVKYFVKEYEERQERKKRIIKPGFFEGLAMRLRGEAFKVTEGSPVTVIHGHMVDHQEGRCEQCWKTERMTDNIPETEDGTP